MSQRKSDFGAVAERYANLYDFRLKTTYKTSYDNNMSYLNSYLIDHIVTKYEEKVTESGGVIDTSLSDHQLIFCTRKIKRVKTNNYKQIFFHSLKNYSMENFEQELKNISFPNYKKFIDVTLPTVT